MPSDEAYEVVAVPDWGKVLEQLKGQSAMIYLREGYGPGPSQPLLCDVSERVAEGVWSLRIKPTINPQTREPIPGGVVYVPYEDGIGMIATASMIEMAKLDS